MIYAYIRTSTQMQENSLDCQRRAIESYLAQKGIRDEVRFFEDFGVSGKKANRPALDEMMEELRKASEPSMVICYSISRLGRSVLHLLNLMEELDGLSVNVQSVTEAIDTNSPFGRLLLNLLASLAQMERELIVQRVQAGLKGARARGKVLGRPKTRNEPLILELANKGYLQRDIAKLSGVSVSTVSRTLAAHLQKNGQKDYAKNETVA